MRDSLTSPPPRFHVDLSIEMLHGRTQLRVAGWVCSHTDVHKLRLHANGTEFSAPIGYPRPDVYGAVNADRSYPFFNSYFCGINAVFELSETQVEALKAFGATGDLVYRDGSIVTRAPFTLDSNDQALLSG